MLKKVLFSRHYLWAWVYGTILFGIALGLFYLMYRGDRQDAWKAFEQHVADVVDVLATSATLMLEGGYPEDSLDELFARSLSWTIAGITLREASGAIVVVAGDPDANGSAGDRVVSRSLRAKAAAAETAGFQVASDAYVLEVVVNESDPRFAAESAKTTWWWLLLLASYIWIRECSLARTRYVHDR